MDPNIATARDEHVRLSSGLMLCDWSGEVSTYIRGESHNKCSICKKILWSVFDETIDYHKSTRRTANW